MRPVCPRLTRVELGEKIRGFLLRDPKYHGLELPVDAFHVIPRPEVSHGPNWDVPTQDDGLTASEVLAITRAIQQAKECFDVAWEGETLSGGPSL